MRGGIAIHVVGEGVEKEIKASGWGIGGYSAGATIGNEGTSSKILGVGTGYSRAKAKEEHNPWVRAVILK